MTYSFDVTTEPDKDDDRIPQASDATPEDIRLDGNIHTSRAMGDAEVGLIQEHIQTALNRRMEEHDGAMPLDEVEDALQPFIDNCDFIACIVLRPVDHPTMDEIRVGPAFDRAIKGAVSLDLDNWRKKSDK